MVVGAEEAEGEEESTPVATSPLEAGKANGEGLDPGEPP